MPLSHRSVLQRFLGRLNLRSVPSEEERQAVLNRPCHAVEARANVDFVKEAERIPALHPLRTVLGRRRLHGYVVGTGLAALLAWVGLNIVSGMTLAGAEKKGVYFLAYPILWIIGLIMWISFIAANQMHLVRQDERAAMMPS